MVWEDRMAEELGAFDPPWVSGGAWGFPFFISQQTLSFAKTPQDCYILNKKEHCTETVFCYYDLLKICVFISK